MRQVEVKGRLEQYLLTTSIAVTLVIWAMGLVFGFLTGSFAIMFDGVYASIDASMAALGLVVARLILKDALRTDNDGPGVDAKGWIISGSITTALLIGFVVGIIALDGTRHSWMRPYGDPVVLAAVCLVVLPLPFSDLRAALAASCAWPPKTWTRGCALYPTRPWNGTASAIISPMWRGSGGPR